MAPAGKSISAGPVIGWAILQLALLGIGALGIPIWAHHPSPGESICLQEMLCGQVIAGSVLFPALSRSWRQLFLTTVLMLPFGSLSGLLSNASPLTTLICFLVVAIWVAGLSGVSLILKSQTTDLWLSCGAIVCTAGFTVLDYISFEAAASSGENFRPISMLAGLCALTRGEWSSSLAPFFFPGLLLIWALVAKKRKK